MHLKSNTFKVFLLFCALFLIITLPVFFQKNHIIKNLEPYPDGILFSLSARNFAMGNGLKLSYEWGQVEFWVPPLYSIYLSFFYFFSKNVITFYLANILLGLGTLFILKKIIESTTNDLRAIIFGLLIYISHFVIFWLPSLAMTENLSMFFFSLLVFSLLTSKLKTKLAYSFISIIGLTLVRFATLPISIAALFIIAIQLKKYCKKYFKYLFLIILFLILLALFLIKTSVFHEIYDTIIISISNNNFFNYKFVYPNLVNYFNSLIFNKGKFLWLNIGITSWPILLIFVTSFFLIKSSLLRKKLNLLLIIFFSLLPLQLLFYTYDSRYLIYSIIIFSISGSWLIYEYKKKSVTLLISLAIIINIFSQKDFVKKIFADNLLGKSTAWQYEAIMSFNKNLKDDQMLITALPPFLIDAYQETSFRPLPMSNAQEFLQKKQLVWGQDVNYENLILNYKNWLKEGRTLYISNAYITHQQTVIDDFEIFKKEFDLELISKGCLDACNIYKLNLKE